MNVTTVMVSLRNRRLGGGSSRNSRAHFTVAYISMGGPGYRGWYSDSLRTVRFGVRTPLGQKDFLFWMPMKTGPGANPDSCMLGTVAVYAGGGGRGVLLTTHCQLAPRLRMRGLYPCSTSLRRPLPSYTSFCHWCPSFSLGGQADVNKYKQILSAVTISVEHILLI
jgi:hypothetical protein